MVDIYENHADFEKELPLVEPKPPLPQKFQKGDFSLYLERFLVNFETRLSEVHEVSGPTIKVSEVLGGLARIYERIRTTIEYKGEHVLRRNAIERILKRLIWEKSSIRFDLDEKKVSESLIRELIWARYVPNNYLSQDKIEAVKEIIAKYLYLLKNSDNNPPGVSTSKIRSWIWGVASSEIEDTLDPSYRELFVTLMYDWFVDYFDWKDVRWDEHQKEIQIYLAVHRAFTKSDEPIMRYHLLLKDFPQWRDADESQIHKLILEFPKIYSEIEEHLEFPGRFALYRLVRKHSAAFDIFRDIAASNKLDLRKLLADKQKFELEVRKVCETKYALVGKRVNTGIVRSIIYIFATKVFFAMLLEIPYEILVHGAVRYLPLSINTIVPPAMMWLIGFSIKIPGAKNTEAIIHKLDSLVYQQEAKRTTPFSIEKSGKNTRQTTFFGIVYGILFALVFGGMTYILTVLDFTILGILIFFMFLSLVILFAFRVRFNANELKVETEPEGLMGHFASYLTLPLLNFGFYLSQAMAKLNFFTILLDFLIEVPLKNIIEIFEEWTSFIREKEEEVVEIPE